MFRIRKNIKTILLIYIGFLIILWLERPLRDFLVSINYQLLTAKYFSGIVVRIALILLALCLICKMNFSSFTGLNSIKQTKELQAVLLPLSFVLFGIIASVDNYTLNYRTTLLYLFFVLAVGFVEELVFRGLILPLTILVFKSQKKCLLFGAITSGLLFGTLHFVNLFNQPENIVGITSQVFFALSIGIFFSGLMLRTENIIIPALLHALINFGFGSGELDTLSEVKSIVDNSGLINWSSVISTTLFFSFILFSGVYMIYKSDKIQIMKKLKILN